MGLPGWVQIHMVLQISTIWSSGLRRMPGIGCRSELGNQIPYSSSVNQNIKTKPFKILAKEYTFLYQFHAFMSRGFPLVSSAINPEAVMCISAKILKWCPKWSILHCVYIPLRVDIHCTLSSGAFFIKLTLLSLPLTTLATYVVEIWSALARGNLALNISFTKHVLSQVGLCEWVLGV